MPLLISSVSVELFFKSGKNSDRKNVKETVPWDLFPFFMNLNSLDPERDRATRFLSSIFCSKDSTWAVMNRLKHFRKFFCFVKIFDYKVRKSPVNRAGRLRQFSRWRAKMSRHQKIVACRFFANCSVALSLSRCHWRDEILLLICNKT